MKTLYSLFALLFGLASINAQQSVRLEIEHLLNGNAFSSSATAQNDLGNDFTTSRLEYYIAEVVLVHDGGQWTSVDDTWFLADASQVFNESLGSFGITQLEGIRFAIGVEQPTNHLDPASYPMTHPLAPKVPSMHWGWSAGYRFVCMEGVSLGQTYEIHALGNDNYITQFIATQGLTQGTDLVISLKADYAEAMRGIDLSSGLIRHGTTLESADLLDNFSLHVFTSHEGNTAVLSQDEIKSEEAFSVYPNPSTSHFTVDMPLSAGQSEWRLSDICGKLIGKGSVRLGESFRVEAPQKGVYLLQIETQNGQFTTRKLIRQ
jgi:hypothetical protein